jgi:hypothetical protein
MKHPQQNMIQSGTRMLEVHNNEIAGKCLVHDWDQVILSKTPQEGFGALYPLGSDQSSDHLIVLQTALGNVRA